ncbi:hypothetical protein Scep_018839 [Stephania cephalantha]|uniref:Uncharacterized protein n=1 Tax=Stephania cephalantha TaxID=152367 RepID=A0AAP0I9U2_9MAGN
MVQRFTGSSSSSKEGNPSKGFVVEIGRHKELTERNPSNYSQGGSHRAPSVRGRLMEFSSKSRGKWRALLIY